MKYTRFRHPITGRTYYRKNRTTHTPIIVLVLTIVAGLYFDSQKPVQLVSPIAEGIEVHASEVTVTPTPTPVPTEGWEEFVVAVDKVAPMYNFPKNVVLAQGALESGRGNSTFSKERNNYLGIGAYDNDPGQAFHFENEEQCVIEYMRLIKRNFPEAWANRDNPEALLHALKVNEKGMMYATDPNYETKVKSMREWSN